MLIDRIIEGFEKNNIRLYGITEIIDGKVDSRIITPDSKCHNGYSVAKAYTATAIGMLYDEGKLKTEERVYDILRESFPDDHDPKWEQVTVHDLLLHKIGLDKGFLDIDTEDIHSYGTDDFLRYAFSHSLPNPVGVDRVYSDAAFYILSRIVAKKSGVDLCEYLRTRLFNPLGFSEIAWSVCPHGYSMGATGLYCSTRDMAKLGVVYLNNGVYNGKQIVSPEWVDIMLSRGYELKPRSKSEMESWCKGGMYGQMLWLSKKHNCVIAWHSFNKIGYNKTVLDELEM